METMVLLANLALSALSSFPMQDTGQVEIRHTVRVTLDPIVIEDPNDPLFGLGVASYPNIDAK